MNERAANTLIMIGASIASLAVPFAPAARAAAVEIRRTADGVPHLRAPDWRSLGAGIGYVQAQDAPCTLAEGFVTYAGQRSRFFGAEERPARDSTFGRARNLDLDIFFRGVVPDDVAARYRAREAPELTALVAGYADGYDRALREARRTPRRTPRHAPACIGQPWVRDITPDDVYRRLYALQVAAGLAHFIPEIAAAAPPGGSGGPVADATLATRLAHRLGTQDGLGSNAMAFGGEATGDGGAVLLGNPHWYWGGPDRFYQMHLTIPGQLDVAGVAMLGVPVVMIGFNRDVAWSHTVSAARRFGLFDLTLRAGDPKSYLVDGVAEPMQERTVRIEVRGAAPVMHTLRRSRFGPIVDLGAQDAALGWRDGHALALRDVNEDNFRVFSNFLGWDRAASLDEFIAIQKREAAMPWVNTIAIGRGDPRVWYADMGAVPAASDALRARCATPRSAAFARADAATPVLDGSRSGCDWASDSASPVRGALPASALPGLLSRDEVANMNDSHWLANPDTPLEGYPAVLGDERRPLSLRSRFGHELARSLARAGASSSADLAARLMREGLAARSYPAEHFRSVLLGQACGSAVGELESACALLGGWTGAAEAGNRGALLWDAFWRELQAAAPDMYLIPFAADDPIDTPRLPLPPAPVARDALIAAVAAMKTAGLAVDAPAGDRLFVSARRGPIRLFGGCAEAGYFAVACLDQGEHSLGPDTIANSYLQVVRFTAEGVDGRTLLAHGQGERSLDGDSEGVDVLVRRYARKAWTPFAFEERDVARGTVGRVRILPVREPSTR